MCFTVIMDNFVNAKTLKTMLISGLNNLKVHVSEVNDLNVFPVPDGDTGTNMLSTYLGGITKIKDNDCSTVKQLFEDFSSGSLLGARGNSGVILSQFFKGVALGLPSSQAVSVLEFANAFKRGVECAYKAVVNPVEGTILTVFRCATEYACSLVTPEQSLSEFVNNYLKMAKTTLNQTKEMLEVLADAGVVDSGGAGFVYILEGLLSNQTAEVSLTAVEVENCANVDLFKSDSVLKFGYCTEFILRLQSAKVELFSFDSNLIVEELTQLGGESIVCAQSGDVVKVHVHTLFPGNVINVLQKYGELLTAKIENMDVQNAQVTSTLPKKKTAVICVASGDGVKELFLSLGADYVIDGGQTSNPSTSDFLTAFDKVNAKNIVVMPNNSNVIMSALQAKQMYEKANVFVAQTKNLQQGYVALSLINTECEDLDEHVEEISKIYNDVICIDVTYAVRDAVVSGINVIKNNYMAISGKNLLATESDKVSCAINAIKSTDNLQNKEILTVFYGNDLTEAEIEKFESLVEENFENLELIAYNGNQAVYSFLIAIE